MASKSNIATKARKKAEADFTTWLMMAKLGGFDELPPNAQSFLTAYRTRLETMGEAALAIREVYAAYYSEMGGEGAAPDRKLESSGKMAMSSNCKSALDRQSRPAAPRHSISPTTRKSLRALLIFAGMVALIFLYRFLTH